MTPEFCKNIYQKTYLNETRKYKKNLKLGGERC